MLIRSLYNLCRLPTKLLGADILHCYADQKNILLKKLNYYLQLEIFNIFDRLPVGIFVQLRKFPELVYSPGGQPKNTSKVQRLN